MTDTATFESTVTDILDNAFFGCTNLTHALIPSSVTRIGNSSFEGCIKLTDGIIPSSVTSIGTRAFYGCSSLTDVFFNRFATNFGGPGATTLGLNCFSGTTSINYTNFACLHTIYNNGYTESSLRSGLYKDYSETDPDVQPTEYFGAGFDNSAVDYAITGACFNEDTKILCFNPETNEEYYTPIQNLKKGDLVKTYLHGYRKIDIICTGKLRNNIYYFGKYMCKMRKTETNSLIEDLIVTGAHALLVDELSEEERLKTTEVFSKWRIPFILDEKYLLLAGISDKFEIMKEDIVYTYYHFCVENDGNDETRYGVWANGVLVETPCKKNILEFRNVSYM